MTDTITKLTIKQDTIKLLTQYEKDDINQKIGTNKVAINIKNAINKNFFELV